MTATSFLTTLKTGVSPKIPKLTDKKTFQKTIDAFKKKIINKYHETGVTMTKDEFKQLIQEAEREALKVYPEYKRLTQLQKIINETGIEI